MSEKRCENDAHNWICQQQEGMLGEIVAQTPLTHEQVKLVTADTNQVNTVCPGGTIVCGVCGAPFPHSHPQESQNINFSQLQEKLQRSTRKQS